MRESAMGLWRSFFNGLLSKERSLATGLVLAFMGWTLTRLVDGITNNATIEYRIDHQAETLADGRAGFKTLVVLTNLSSDTAFANLRAALASPGGDIVFSTHPDDRRCAFQSPGGLGYPVCKAYSTGYDFQVPMFLAGKSVEFWVKYTTPAGGDLRPTLHVQPDGTRFQLVEAGFRTKIARHQTLILLCILGVAILALILSVAAGVSEQREAK